MTYTLGGRRIDVNHMLDADVRLVVAHGSMFRKCLNQLLHRYLGNVKHIIHLYTDILTIYTTLLKKIPAYDDITEMTDATRQALYQLEDLVNVMMGPAADPKPYLWEDRSYGDVQSLVALVLTTTEVTFQDILKTLHCIDIFFDSFSNLKKLLIPFLYARTQAIHKSLTKALYLYKLPTVADDPPSTDNLSKKLHRIEKITSGIERELTILATTFDTFDRLLQQYTSVLLGKAILKREIDDGECTLIRRREVCYRAAEHVVSIPLTDEQSAASMMSHFTKYFLYVMGVVVVVVCVMVHRLLRVLGSV